MTIMRRQILGVCIILSCIGVPVHAQVLDTLPRSRPNRVEGTHFFVGFMQNEITIQESGLRLRVLIATAYPNRVIIRYPDGIERAYTLQAYETLPLVLSDTLELRWSERPLRRAVEIIAELPISVIAMSSQYTTSDSYTALPIDLWGTEYVVLSLPNDTYGDGYGTPVDPADIRQSEFMIIAHENGTQVEFQPTVPTEGGRAAGQWHTVMLNRGECFLVKAAPSQQGTGDLSGTMVRSSKPIGVLSGHVRASVPIGLPPMLDSKDHLVEMLLPNALLSSSYVTVPFATGGRLPIGDYLRAVAIYPDTRITIYTEREDLQRVLAQPGDTLTLPNVNSPTWWNANKPFALVQLMTTGSVANSITFDPSMVIAPPIGRYVSRCVIHTPANLNDATFSRQFDRHWVNIICDENARLSLKLDGEIIAQRIAPELATQKFRSSGMFWAQIPLSPGVHVLTADSGVFTGVVYGMGYTDSYAHPIGLASSSGRDTIVPRLILRDSCGSLMGSAYDEGGSGIAYIVVDPDSTRNYDFRMTTTNGIETFQAVLTDPYRDATIAIIARDNAGNGVRYRYRYSAPTIGVLPRPLRFQVQVPLQEQCTDATLRNYSFRDTLVIYRIQFANRDGIFRLNQLNWPILCPPRREVKVTVCFEPSRVGTFQDTLLWDLGCGRIYRQAIEAKVAQASIETADLDFGDVLVGDTACKALILWNTGTVPTTVTQLIPSPPRSAFVLDSPALPKQIQPGDSLLIRICFVPSDTGNFQTELVIGNDNALKVSAALRGRGIRARLQTVPLDCGARRIGVRYDTVAHIINRGTADARLRYRGQQGDSSAFLHSFLIGDTMFISRGGQRAIPIRFAPEVAGEFSSLLLFDVDGGSSLELEMKGRGTIPTVTMQDTTIGPVNVGDRRMFTVTVLSAGGTEALTIDSLWIGGPDWDAFVLESIPPFPIQVQPGERVFLPVWFQPRRVGIHEASIVARHDAQPNFLRTTASAHLWGIAIERDTSDGGPTDTTGTADTSVFRMDVEYDPTPFQCSALDVQLILTNAGSTPLRMSEAGWSDQRGNAVNILPRLPTVIQPGEVIRSRVIIPPPQMNRDITIRVVANDSLVRQRIVRITPTVGTTDVNIATVHGSIDSVILYRVQGMIVPAPLQTLPFNVEVQLPIALAEYPGDGEVPVVASCNQHNVNTLASVTLVGNNRLLLRWEFKATTTALHQSSCTWEFELPLRLLYALNPVGTVCVNVYAGECYSSDTACAVLSSEEVCGHPLRAVKLGGLAVKNIVPNPMTDHVQIVCDVYETTAMTLWAYDLRGIGYRIGRQESLDVGQRVIIFGTESLPSGWYSLVIETSSGRQMVECCFLKH